MVSWIIEEIILASKTSWNLIWKIIFCYDTHRRQLYVTVIQCIESDVQSPKSKFAYANPKSKHILFCFDSSIYFFYPLSMHGAEFTIVVFFSRT